MTMSDLCTDMSMEVKEDLIILDNLCICIMYNLTL